MPNPSLASVPAAPRAAGLTFGRSLVISTAIHATALGCSLWIAFGTRPGVQGSGPEAYLVFAEPQEAEVWQTPEPEPSQVELPEEPTAELVDVEEEPVLEPFEPDPALTPTPLESVAWTELGSEPLEDLRERLAEQQREQALAEAVAVAQTAPPAAAPAAPRGEDRPLRLIDSPRPPYPRISLRLEEQGTVLVRIHVGPDGHVTDVDLLETSGFARLDEAALEAVRRWRFDPRMEDGHAVADTFDHRVVFVLEEPVARRH